MADFRILTRWFIKGMVFFCLVLVSSGFLFASLPGSENSFFGAFADKHNLLENVPSPRVIVVGGSSVAFGLDSPVLETRLGMPVINDGLHAGLGLQFILSDLSPLLQSGDLIVLVPEYEGFYGKLVYGEDRTFALLLAAFPQAAWSFRLPQISRLPEILSAALELKLNNQILAWNDAFSIDPIYNQDAFNENGDIISHLGLPTRQDISDESVIEAGEVINKYSIRLINRFAWNAQKKEADVVVVYPPLRMTNCVASHAWIEQLDASLPNRLSVPILSKPQDTCYSDDRFFDTAYHLNQEGRSFFTDFLAERLLEYLKSDKNAYTQADYLTIDGITSKHARLPHKVE